MTTNRIGGPRVQGRAPQTHSQSPVHGQRVDPLKTQGVPQQDERVAAAKLQQQLDPRDLDVFLKARAGEKVHNRGLIPSLQRMLGKDAPAEPWSVATQQVSQSIAHAMSTLKSVYADGLVTEREITALYGAQQRLRAVLDLAQPQVLNMLPRDVRERLQDSLFEPLQILEAAAQRRGDRVMNAVIARDDAALRERLSNPVQEYRLFSPADEARAGRPLVSEGRYQVGDLVCVPRSSGGTSLAVVVDKDEQGQLRVELLDQGRFALKTLRSADLVALNPIKIGDYLEIDDKQVWVKGLGADGKLEAVVKDRQGTSTVGGAAFEALVREAHVNHALAAKLESLPGMKSLPEVTRRLARFALDVGPSDPVFGRLSKALSTSLGAPEKYLGATAAAQADQLTRLLRESPDNLHSVLPNFRTERDVALVSSRVTAQGPGVHALFHLKPGQTAPGFVEHEVSFFHSGEQVTLKVVDTQPRPPVAPGKRLANLDEVIYNLAKLPIESLREIKNVVINPTASPDDEYWQREFNNPNHTAFMSAHADKRTLTIFPSHSFTEMEQSLAHEVGHFVASARFGRSQDPRWKEWDAAQKTDNLSVSRYAKNNLDEDFAETYSLYTMTKGTPAHERYRGLMPNRFAALDRLATLGPTQ